MYKNNITERILISPVYVINSSRLQTDHRLFNYLAMQKPTTHKELRTTLTDDRYRILEVLAKHDELRSSEIRDYAEIPDGSKHYQLSMLDS